MLLLMNICVAVCWCVLRCVCLGKLLLVCLYLWISTSTTHCNTLQHTATHCTTLQHTVTHCNTLQHATHCNTLQHTLSLLVDTCTAMFGGVLWCVVVCCGVLWCAVVCDGLLWCVVVRCIMLRSAATDQEIAHENWCWSIFTHRYMYCRVWWRCAVCCSVLWCAVV